MPADEVLDPSVVAELRLAQEAYGNPEFIAQLVTLFRTHAPVKIERIREAVAAGNAPAIEHLAHTLKTNCAMLGATQMAGACGRMEMAAVRADLPAAAAAMEEAEQLLPGVLAALSDL